MTVREVRDYLRTGRTVLLPYGVVEQHGYHLPLDTDIRNAEVMGGKLAVALGCLVAPTLNYCFSGGLLEGTINVAPNTFSTMVCEIVKSLAMQGFENIIIVPGHGGSESLIHLKESLRIQKWLDTSLANVLVLLTPLWDFSPTWLELFRSRDYHAGMAETSLLMHWCPEVVRSEIEMDAEDVSEMMRKDPDSFQVRSALTSLKHEVPATAQDKRIAVGVMGFPEKASPELGRKITEEIMKNAVPALRGALQSATENRRTGKRNIQQDNEGLKIFSI